MSYQVIARKYRPQRFADVVGQQHVTDTLANAIRRNRIAHAYLFCGPRGTGKTTIARIFAKGLRCKNGPTTEPCNECPDCAAITNGNSLEMMEFDAASNTQVDKIRDIIIDHVKYAPGSGAVKLYLIDEVHMLSTSSFNALLKTLEEPPPHVKFLFATTDPEKLPPTILSRCQRFDLRRIPIPLIVGHLEFIARNEGVAIDDPALHAIARGAEGCMRDAESTLDQIISFCGSNIVESDVLSMFGLAARGQILELARAVLAGEAGAALRQLNDLAKGGKDLGRLLSDLLDHFRNLLIYLVSNGDLTMLEVSESEAEQIKRQSALATPDAMGRVMEALADAETRMRDATSKKILIEVALLRAIEARNALPIDTVLKQLQLLREPAGGSPPASAPPRAAPGEPASYASSSAFVPPEPARLADAPAPVADIGSLWAGLLEAVGRASPFVRDYLGKAHPVSFAKNVFTIGFDPEFADHVELIDNSKNHTLLQTKLAEIGHHGAQFKFIKAEATANRVRPAAPPPRAPAPSPAGSPKPKPEPVPFNPDEFKNDPLIQKALEEFKGRVVEVRASGL